MFPDVFNIFLGFAKGQFYRNPILSMQDNIRKSMVSGWEFPSNRPNDIEYQEIHRFHELSKRNLRLFALLQGVLKWSPKSSTEIVGFPMKPTSSGPKDPPMKVLLLGIIPAARWMGKSPATCRGNKPRWCPVVISCVHVLLIFYARFHHQNEAS